MKKYLSTAKVASFLSIILSVFFVVGTVQAATVIGTDIQTDGALSVSGLASFTGNTGIKIDTSPAIGYNVGCGIYACGTTSAFSILGGPNGTGVIPVPTFYPTDNNQVLALDLVPHGTPTDGGYGVVWNDLCTTDQILSGNAPTTCLHLGAGTSPSGLFIGGATYNSGTPLPVNFGQLNGDVPSWTLTMQIDSSANLQVLRPMAVQSTLTTTGLATFASGVGIGTTTPIANLQVANGSNATTTMEIGSKNQNKGSCLKLYRTDGSAIYAYVAAGATTFTLSTSACASVANF